MNEDLVLNVSTGPLIAPGSLNTSQVAGKLKKGSWMRRRVVAKKIIHRANKKQATTILDNPEKTSLRNKYQSVENPIIESAPAKRNIEPTPYYNNKKLKQSNAPFVTSLFTCNPVIPSAVKSDAPFVTSSLPVFSASTFHGIGLHPLLIEHLKLKLKVDNPTPIQMTAIPHLIYSDQDAIIQAQTGSGKTYAFLLPILHRLISSAANFSDSNFFSRVTGTFGIILVPTRELAQQISSVLEKLLCYNSAINNASTSNDKMPIRIRHWIVSGIVTGGEKRKSEKARLRKGNTILVCTPGRLLDHLKTTDSFNVGNVRWLVLDEADNLLSLGFEQTLKEILEILDLKRNQVDLSLL